MVDWEIKVQWLSVRLFGHTNIFKMTHVTLLSESLAEASICEQHEKIMFA